MDNLANLRSSRENHLEESVRSENKYDPQLSIAIKESELQEDPRNTNSGGNSDTGSPDGPQEVDMAAELPGYDLS